MIDAHPAATHVTPYDRLESNDVQVERMLASGEHRDALIDYFGTAEYVELVVLARRAAQAAKRAAPRVYILPGIMGSQLGKPRSAGLPHDILWVDPIDIAIGRLREIALRTHSPVRAMGVILYSFLRLRLRLRIAGFAPLCFDYDWRRSVIDLGRALADAIAADSAPRVHIVAHSMGGLVARAALALPGSERIGRVVMLGTPNAGSFAPVQALRGTYSVVRKLATLDQVHSAETLASEVYSSFPGLYELLPAEGTTALDLFDAGVWPARGPQPDAALLAAARSALRGLAGADPRMSLIAGHAQPTVTGVQRAGRDFEYLITRDGDGTVPLAHALLAGVPTWFAREGHSELTTNGTIISAVIDLLRTGRTRRLPTELPRATRVAARVSDAALRKTYRYKVDWHSLSNDERREFLATLNSPPALPPKATARTARAPAVSRAANKRPARKSTRGVLEILIARGDIQNADAQAVAVGVFAGVHPAGAAAALDHRLGGAITEFAARRMLSGETGQISSLPAAGRLAHASQVVIVGLGRFADLDAAAIELAAESVARYCEHGRISSLASVPWGAGSGLPATLSFAAQLRGYLRQRAERSPRLARITFTIRDAREHRAIARLAALLAREIDPDGVSLQVRRVDQRAAPPAAQRPARSRAARPSTVPRIAHLLVERITHNRNSETWRAAVLTAGAQAAVISETLRFSRADLDALLGRLDGDALSFAGVTALGARLAKLVLHENVRSALATTLSEPLIVVNDAPASRLPWEMLTLGGWSPAIRAGLSRRFAAGGLSVARFSERRRSDSTLTVLLIVNPTGDLPGAAREGERVRDLFRGLPDARLTLIEGSAATRARVLAEFDSGDYDVVHYAGHAAFNAGAARASGLYVSDGIVTGSDLGALAQLPALVFFNACESARVRGAKAPASRAASLVAGASVAEAWLRAGIANFIGTYWPVGDAAAETCADKFYTALIAGRSIGAALLAARHAVHAQRSPDWADYLHYGDPQFTLKSAD